MLRRIALNGEWQFCEAGTEAWKAGTVPGCVQLDLIRLGELPDPYYRLNELAAYGLETKEWIYRRTFDLSAEDLNADRLQLVFEGIDTYADIHLNDYYLGRAENMFIPYRYEIEHYVVEGRNTLEVRLHSPLTTIQTLAADSPVTLASSCEPARPYIRKAQYAYGWDWGPRIVQVGLWRGVYIECYDHVALEDPFFYTEALEDGAARVRIQANVACYDEWDEVDEIKPLQAEVWVKYQGEVVAQAQTPVVNGPGLRLVDVRLTIPDAHLWWPNGYGAQPLYDIGICLMEEGAVVAEHCFRSGLRTVRILQEADVEGRSFILLINGVKVYAKGADWIPADNVLPRLTREDYFKYIQLTQQANMNMLRIWGGGIYEDPAFYEACDELGIMVWQDFMYACAQYPDEFDWFQQLAREEAVAVVKALRNHPALVLWCGNNENNWGFDEWWRVGQPKYLGNYVYREILPHVCAEYDPSRPYWVSSPYGGEHPNGMEEGDRHSWGVWSGWQDYSGYLRDTGRFISEFGFQALPNWKTVLSFTQPEDRSILSPVMISHNKMVDGTERLMRFMVGRLGFPKDLQSFVYLTQFNQAEAIKTGVEHWRARKFMTSGALYWQLNDCWPVASWACLDYYKRKKGLYYYSTRFYAPILPVLKQESEDLALSVVSDLLQAAQAQVRIVAYKLNGAKLAEQRLAATLLANDVSKLARFTPADLGIGYSPRVLPVDGSSTTNPREFNGELLDTVVYVEVKVGEQTYTNYHVFDRFRNLQIEPAAIAVQVEGHTITLSSPVPAFGVFVEPERDVDLSDNCLNLEPGVRYTLQCSGAPGHVRVYSLTDMVNRI